jgi:hypothetical protein
MARMLVKYVLQEENKVGVEKTKEGGLYLPFSFGQSPNQISDKIGDTLFDIINKNKNEVIQIYFEAFFEGQKVLDGHFYTDDNPGGSTWTNQASDTIH